MSVVVGRVRNGIDARSLQLTLLSHNTIRGAAGTAILTAELMEREGYLGVDGSAWSSESRSGWAG